MAKRATDPRLKTYASKRDFESTPEPSTDASAPSARTARKASRTASFCVQKHLASHLHYDFRLEHEGVLLSWSVPKGPSLNPTDKRMAIRTEDHPFDYREFEGVIPTGYGAGVVLLWDRGTWTPEVSPSVPDVAAMLDKGEIKFKLDGVKLKGSWVLVRTRPRPGSSREHWLLIKHRDDWSGDVDVAALAPDSVKTFRDLPHILADSGKLDTMAEHPPVAGGETGKLWREVIEAARGEPGKQGSTRKVATVRRKKTGAKPRAPKRSAR
jgi:bifunctional non-homologous end joining protein LigD